jgi:hypothetical protein
MHMLRKGQIEGMAKGDVLAQNRAINQMFGLATSRVLARPLLTPRSVFATLPRVNTFLTPAGNEVGSHAEVTLDMNAKTRVCGV